MVLHGILCANLGVGAGGGLQEGGPQGKPSEGWFRRPQADGSGEAGAPGGPYAGGLQGVVEANGQRKTPRHSRGGIGGDGMVSGGGEGRRPPARRAGKRAKPASALRSSAGPAARILGSAGGRDYIFARATAMRAAQRALLSASWTLEAKDSPPVSSLILASRNGVICLPWMWAASASASA